MRNPHKGHQEPGTRVGGVRIKAWRLLDLHVASPLGRPHVAEHACLEGLGWVDALIENAHSR